MITNRGAALLLAITFTGVGFAANRALPTEAPPAPALVHHEGPSPKYELVRYEDGSGVLYIGNKEVETYPEDTFVWHCESMGNHICGDIDNADIKP